MNKKLIWSIALLVVVLELIGGGIWYNSAHPAMTSDKESHEGGGDHREGRGDKGKEHQDENKLNTTPSPAASS